MFDFTENHNITHEGVVKSELIVHRSQEPDDNERRAIKDTINKCISFIYRASAICSGHEEVHIHLRVPIYFKGKVVTAESDFQSIQDTIDFVNSMGLPQRQKPVRPWFTGSITTLNSIDLSASDATTEENFDGIFPG